MEERSLRVYDSEKTFFSKLTNTLTKIIIPTQVGINSMLISIKRNNVLKTYENTLEDIENVEKKEAINFLKSILKYRLLLLYILHNYQIF